MLSLYNSLERQLQPFVPLNRKSVKLYTCGPTVYARPHIGNFRTYAFEDALKRYLIYSGYSVKHVMNITDIDNTVMKESRKTGIARAKLTEKFEAAFRKDAALLRILPANAYPRVSEYTARMARVAVKLMKKGKAYKDERCRLFFDISRFPSYGKLAGKRITGSRKVTREEYKPFQAGDFLLLNKCRERNCEKCFKTSLGMCQPAWNVQCATMATSTLGNSIDISMGGFDNLFNHHENTRAIANSLCGHEFSKYYVHVKHLIVDGAKMSKSKGNVVLLPDLLAKGFSPQAVRMLLLSVHHRKRLNFTWDYASGVKGRYLQIAYAIGRIRRANFEGAEGFSEFAEDAKSEFEASLDDDMDLPSALSVAERFAKECAEEELSRKQAKEAIALLRKFDSVLACLPL